MSQVENPYARTFTGDQIPAGLKEVTISRTGYRWVQRYPGQVERVNEPFAVSLNTNILHLAGNLNFNIGEIGIEAGHTLSGVLRTAGHDSQFHASGSSTPRIFPDAVLYSSLTEACDTFPEKADVLRNMFRYGAETNEVYFLVHSAVSHNCEEHEIYPGRDCRQGNIWSSFSSADYNILTVPPKGMGYPTFMMTREDAPERLAHLYDVSKSGKILVENPGEYRLVLPTPYKR